MHVFFFLFFWTLDGVDLGLDTGMHLGFGGEKFVLLEEDLVGMPRVIFSMTWTSHCTTLWNPQRVGCRDKVLIAYEEVNDLEFLSVNLNCQSHSPWLNLI